MTKFFSGWSWLDDGALPGLIAIIRACWVWPWLVLVQLGLSPEYTEAALPLWGVLLLPILAFTLARWVSQQPTDRAPAIARSERPPLLPRLGVGLLGIGLAVIVVWWQLYQNNFGLFDFTWVNQMGDSLIHWPETSIPPAVLLLVTGLFLWMRGLLDAGNSMTHDTVWQIFLTGITMMILYLIVITLADLDRVSQLITSVLVMLAAGMGVLAFSSVKITTGLDRALGFGFRNVGDDGNLSMDALDSQAMPVVNRYWFLSVGGVIGLLMVLGILLTLLIAPEVMEAALNVLWTVATFVGDLAAQLLLGLAYVGAAIVFFFYQLLEPLIKRLMERMELEPEIFDGMEPPPEETAEAMEIVEQAPVPDEYRWIGLAIIGVITLIAFAIAIRRLASNKVETQDEERESILSADLLQDQLGNLWDRLRGRFRRQDPDDPFLALDGEDSRRRIRAVYQSLLRMTNELGQPRGPAWTPVEYSSRLAKATAYGETAVAIEQVTSVGAKGEADRTDVQKVLHQFYGSRFAPQLDRITAGYVAARYGDESPADSLAADVEAAWREIERELMQEKKEPSS